MTDLEKAASGLLYDANSDPALLEARAQTSDLCMDYNALRSSQKEEKNALLHTILGACAPDIVIEPPFFIDYGSHTRVGRAFYANHNLVILDAAPVTIGDHVFIGPELLYLDRRPSVRCCTAQRRTGICQAGHHRQ